MALSELPEPRAPRANGKSSPARDNFVDYARFGLALSVCLFHTNAKFHNTWSSTYGLPWAVPAFLSISGFYVLRSYEQSGTWVEFIKKRILRIVPAFLVSLLIVGLAGGFPMVWHVFVFYATVGTVRLGPFVNAPVWSLGAEEIAYVLLAVLFTVGAYRKKWPIWIAFIASCIFVQVLPFLTTSDPILLIFPIAPAFFAGSLVYIYRDRLKGSDWWGFALIAIALALPAFIETPRPTHPIGFISYAPGFLLGVGILTVRSFRLPKIPDFSYGLYVYHFALLRLLQDASEQVYFLSLAVLLVASWYLVEKPALSLKNRRRRPPAVPAVSQPVDS